MAIYYAHDEQRALFKSLKSADEDSWRNFKSNVLGYLYPDAYFNMEDLRRYLQSFWALRLNSRTSAQDLRKFYGGFLLIANDVQEKSKQKYHRKELGEMFLDALPPLFSAPVLRELKAEAGGVEQVITPHRVFGKAIKLVDSATKDSLAKLY
ncbi:hypothetical protein CPB83DRAFT_850324 [Crepidotus variabilis]|uniref:Uncharacterized protein n=1 Tax=Crepidotus variabilis TaxID=179855 RepID=A0A9P6JS01_9AGAR|nr:hypothetical protein CPB83DRAFT_850324 [Crepidotus variabilis]